MALIIIILFYFLPTIIAVLAKKDNALSISILNLFFGWTLIGWVISLVWATTKNSNR